MAQAKQSQAVDLFGNPTLTPRQLMQQQLASLMESTAEQTKGADPRTRGVSMMGSAAGGMLGKLLIEKGVLPKPPEMERAERLAKARDEMTRVAAEEGLDMEADPKGFARRAAGIFMKHGEEDGAAKALQWGDTREALKLAADKERAGIAELKASELDKLSQYLPESVQKYKTSGNYGDLVLDPNQSAKGRGEYFVPVETAEGVKAFDARRGVIVDPATRQPIGKPVIKSSSDPTLQGNLAGTKAQSTAAGTLANDEATNALKISDQVDVAKEGITKLMQYTKGSLGGTGPFATVGGLKRFTDAELQDLEANFNKINLKNLVTTFSGFSRSIDTAVERGAWDRTQPGIKLDDKVNLNILIGNISLGVKAAEEGEARRQYIEASPKKNLEGYKSPVIGRTTTLFDQNGEAQLFPKEQAKELKGQGWMDADQYARFLMTNKKASAASGLPSGWKVKVK